MRCSSSLLEAGPRLLGESKWLGMRFWAPHQEPERAHTDRVKWVTQSLALCLIYCQQSIDKSSCKCTSEFVSCSNSLSLFHSMDRSKPSRSDDLDESLWDSPSKPEGTGKQSNAAKPTYQEQQERDEGLRQELQSVRHVNEAIEGVIQSLRKAKDNMKVVHGRPTVSV